MHGVDTIASVHEFMRRRRNSTNPPHFPLDKSPCESPMAAIMPGKPFSLRFPCRFGRHRSLSHIIPPRFPPINLLMKVQMVAIEQGKTKHILQNRSPLLPFLVRRTHHSVYRRNLQHCFHFQREIQQSPTTCPPLNVRS